MQMVVPKYLEQSIDTLTREQEKFRKQMTNTFSNTPFAPLEEHVRRNMEMFEKTFSMFKPFAAPLRTAATTDAPPTAGGEPPPEEDDIDDLKRQMKEMQDRLERMVKDPENKS
jgi:polyhydroxyalkanoate synthesis regulator protein